MKHIDRIHALESRAHKINLTLSGLCAMVDEPKANIFSWREGKRSPTLRVFGRTMQKLEDRLAAEEDKVRKALLAQNKEHPEPEEQAA